MAGALETGRILQEELVFTVHPLVYILCDTVINASLFLFSLYSRSLLSTSLPSLLSLSLSFRHLKASVVPGVKMPITLIVGVSN